jgi:hypothetical protein
MQMLNRICAGRVSARAFPHRWQAVTPLILPISYASLASAHLAKTLLERSVEKRELQPPLDGATGERNTRTPSAPRGRSWPPRMASQPISPLTVQHNVTELVNIGFRYANATLELLVLSM